MTSLTAPTLGVILGGSLTDHYGGYKDLDGSNRAPARTLRMCTGFCVTGVILALPVLFSRNFWIVVRAFPTPDGHTSFVWRVVALPVVCPRPSTAEVPLRVGVSGMSGPRWGLTV